MKKLIIVVMLIAVLLSGCTDDPSASATLTVEAADIESGQLPASVYNNGERGMIDARATRYAERD